MISISLQESLYQNIIDRMRLGNSPYTSPTGVFYNLSNIVAPYSPRPTVFKVQTDKPGRVYIIALEYSDEAGVGIDPRNRVRQYSIIPQSEFSTVALQLGRGLNYINIWAKDDQRDSDVIMVRTTTIMALWEAWSRILYGGAIRTIEEQQRAIRSTQATRLMEPFVSFVDLLPDVQSLKILATRLTARGLVHNVGQQSGVTDLTTALSVSTPVYADIGKQNFELYPALDSWQNAASSATGQEIHAWLPNLGIASWQAFIFYLNNQPELFKIIKVTEEEIIFEYQGKVQRHKFDFDAYGSDFLTARAITSCFSSIIVTILFHSIHTVIICAPAYTFDLTVPDDSPIGTFRRSFDSGRPFDSGIPFDGDDVDPYSEGWVGLSLTGRFEQDGDANHCLDSFVQPSSTYGGEVCCYIGHYTQIVEHHRYDIELNANITASGSYLSPIYYTLSYDGNGSTGGTDPSGGSYLDGSSVVAATNLYTRIGYDFVGWNTLPDGSGTGYAEAGNITISSNVVLYAIWQVAMYTFLYDGNGPSVTGVASSVSPQPYGSIILVGDQGTLDNPGLVFGGWNTAPDGSGISYSVGANFILTTNTTLYAQWNMEIVSPLPLASISNSNSIVSGIVLGHNHSFSVASVTSVDSMGFMIRRVGNPVGNFTMSIVRNAFGVPSSSPTDIMATLSVDASTIPTAYSIIMYPMSCVLDPGDYYAVLFAPLLDTSGGTIEMALRLDILNSGYFFGILGVWLPGNAINTRIVGS